MVSKVKKEEFTSSYWVERVVIITDTYEIIGNIYMAKSTKKTRLLSELLNGSRKFIAVKDCSLQSKVSGAMEPEYMDFLEINIDSIILIKPYTKE